MDSLKPKINKIQTFKRQSHKMVKHTQTIRQQIADELFEYFWPFCEIGAKRLKEKIKDANTLLWDMKNSVYHRASS